MHACCTSCFERVFLFSVEVIASSGDPRLGGNDWDFAIAAWLADTFAEEHGVPLRGFARRRLLDAAEEAKLALSSQAVTQIELPGLHNELGLNVTLSRRKFEARETPFPHVSHPVSPICQKLILLF